MTRTCRGRRAALFCGVAANALFLLPAHAQDASDTVIDTATTAPVATSVTGSLEIAPGGSITLGEGAAVTIDAGEDVTVGGAIVLDGEAADAVGIVVTGDAPLTGDVTVAGSVSITSAEQTDTGEQPAVFPEGRFGLLVAEGATLTGDVTFAEGSSIVVDSQDGGGVGVFGTIDGDLAVRADLSVVGDGSNGVLVAGTVTGDVDVGAVAPPTTTAAAADDVNARGVGANAVAVTGDVGGRLTVAQRLTSRVFTDNLVGDGTADNSVMPLSAEAQAALVGGNALRVTGDVAGGVLLAAPVTAVADNADTPEDETVEGRTGGTLDTEGSAPALYVGGGALIGARADDPDTPEDESLGGFGLVNDGTITASGRLAEVSVRGVLVEDARIAGGFANGGLLQATGGGLDADAVAIEFGADAVIGDGFGRLRNTGIIEANATTDAGDAIAVIDRSGTLASIENDGAITARLSDFVNPFLPADDTSDEGLPSGQRLAIDVSANTGGVTLENTGLILGDVVFGSGADTFLSDGTDTEDGVNIGQMIGAVRFGAGDDELTLRGGAELAGRDALARPIGTAVFFGAGDETVTVTASSLLADLDFGTETDGSLGGGRLDVLDGGLFVGSIGGADGVDLTVGNEGAQVILRGGLTRIASLTTLEGATVTGPDGTVTRGPGAVLSFEVGTDADEIAGYDVAGDAVIAADTGFQTIFTSAFGDAVIRREIIRAGGTLDIDLSTDRLSAVGVVPFLFSQDLSFSEDGQAVVLTLNRRSPDELGIEAGSQPIFEPLVAALSAANRAVTDGDVTVAADAAVGRALFNLPDQDRFLEAFDQFLPGPLDAPLTYARVQNDSVTSLVTQRVARLRDGSGAHRNAWLQEQSYFVNRATDGAARGFDGGGFVIALGADTPLGPIDTVGVSAAIASARYDEETGEDFPFDRLTYSASLYAAEDLGALKLDGRVGYGWATSESERNVVVTARDEDGQATGVGDIRRTTAGDWDGTQLSAYGRVLYAGRAGGWDVQPFASLDYLRLEEDAYVETGDLTRTTALSVDAREATSLRGNAGVILGREFKTRPSRFDTSIPATIAPRLTLAYSEELDGDALSGTYRFDGGEAFTLTQDKPGGAAVVGADIAYENEYARLGVGGTVTASEDVQIYSLRVGVGLKW